MSEINWDWHRTADALEPVEQPDFVLDKYLYRPSLNVVYGQPGSHKTNLLIDIAVCSAMGIPWLGHETKQVGVIWIDQDSGLQVLHERFGACIRHHGGTPDTCKILYSSYPQPKFSIKAHNWRNALEELVIHNGLLHTDTGLIVFDNLLTISDVKDENSSEMGEVMFWLRSLAERSDTCVVVIHHDTKKGSDTPRGHSSINGAVDMAIKVRRTKDGVVALKVTKSRFLDPGIIKAQYMFTHYPDTSLLHTAYFQPEEATYREEAETLMEEEGVSRATAYRRLQKDISHLSSHPRKHSRK